MHKPLIVWDGSNIEDNAPKSKDSLIKKVAYTFVRFIIQHCDATVAEGPETKRFLLYLGSNSDKIFTVPKAINNFFFRERLRAVQKKLHIYVKP